MISPSLIQFWNDSTPPEDVSKLLRNTKAVNEGFLYNLFDDESALSFLEKEFDSTVKAAYLKSRLPAMRSDLFRVAYLFRFGGIYLDAATHCFISLKPFVGKGKLTLLRKWHGGICNGFISSPKGNEFLGRILDNIISNINNESSHNVWLVSGPGAFKFLDEDPYQDKVSVVDQVDMKQFFDFVNNLEHKGESHWSKKQEVESIFY